MRRNEVPSRPLAGWIPFVLAAGIVASVVTGCSGGSPSPAGPTAPSVASIALKADSLTGDSLSIAAGDSAQITATPVDAAGQPVSGVTLTWSSSDTTVATVSSTGLVRSVDIGKASITVGVAGAPSGMVSPSWRQPDAVHPSSVSVRGSGSNTINLNSVAEVELLPETPSVNQGSTQQFAATAVASNKKTPAGWTVGAYQWSSSDPTVATINPTGLATAVGPGTTTITVAIPITPKSKTYTLTYSTSTTLTVYPCSGLANVTSWTLTGVQSSYAPPGSYDYLSQSVQINQGSAVTDATLTKEFDAGHLVAWTGLVAGIFNINNVATSLADGSIEETEIGQGSLDPKANAGLIIDKEACTYVFLYEDVASYKITTKTSSQPITIPLGTLSIGGAIPAPPAKGSPWVLENSGDFPALGGPASAGAKDYYAVQTALGSAVASYFTATVAHGGFNVTSNP